MTTAMEIYAALTTAALPVVLVDAINKICYFSESVSSITFHGIVDSLGWSNAQILLISGPESDPYPQYLDVTRHDQLLRHVLGTTVPHDTSKIDVSCIDNDETLSSDSDEKLPTQKAAKSYIDTANENLDEKQESNSIVMAIIFGD